jgi:hypothetical protein
LAAVIDECRAGRFTSHHQPGHPHGFHSFIWFGEVAVGGALADTDGVFADLQARTRPYPPALRAATVERFGWDARFTLATAAKAAARGDTAYVTACCSRAALDLAVVLYALNERPYLNEKGAVREAARLPSAPTAFEERVRAVLAAASDPTRVREAAGTLGRLVDDVERLA